MGSGNPLPRWLVLLLLALPHRPSLHPPVLPYPLLLHPCYTKALSPPPCSTIDAMEAIFREIKERYAKADDHGKREIQGYIRELQVDFYTDWDVIMRLTSGVRLPCPLRSSATVELTWHFAATPSSPPQDWSQPRSFSNPDEKRGAFDVDRPREKDWSIRTASE